MLGTYALSAGYYDAYYVKAQQVRTLIKAEFDEVLGTVDAILAPTSPTVAFKIGAKVDDPLAMYLNDACTLPVNIAGLPGHQRAVRAVGGPAGRASRSSAEPSTRRRSCAWPMPTSARPVSPTCGPTSRPHDAPLDCVRCPRSATSGSPCAIRALSTASCARAAPRASRSGSTPSRPTRRGSCGGACDPRRPSSSTCPPPDDPRFGLFPRADRRLDRGAARPRPRHGRRRPGGSRSRARTRGQLARRRRRRRSSVPAAGG